MFINLNSAIVGLRLLFAGCSFGPQRHCCEQNFETQEQNLVFAELPQEKRPVSFG